MIDVERPAEAPPSLGAGKTYTGADVMEALHHSFYGKCYLCETPIALGTFEVDHRRPRADQRFAHLIYAWDNLFPTCTTYACNQRRRKRYPDGGLLDPGQGVERRIFQRVEGAVSISLRKAGTIDVVFRAADPADVAAVNTAEELDRIHNGTHSSAIPKADALQRAILEHVSSVSMEVYRLVTLSARPTSEPAAIDDQRRRVQALVSRRAPYAMLVRSVFASLDAVRALFD
ncbi:hypothetical protein [Sorangium sp. So ce233]|uniref:hypothetical protein n=1 Tax=Sorangium sp. So ce233 TaxID=3133290 RepID=UPI003F62606D